MSELWHLSPELIRARLGKAQESLSEEDYLSAFLSDAPRPAAVLVPLIWSPVPPAEEPEWHILLTRRSDRLAEHRGQVAFPGGRCDPEDPSPDATALRETNEEIGLDPADVVILGRLSNMWTITNYSITPVVGVIPWPFPLRLATDEVSRVFTIPLRWLADPTNHEVRQRIIPSPYSLRMQSETHPVIYFHPYDGEILWGVSAEIASNLIRVLK